MDERAGERERDRQDEGGEEETLVVFVVVVDRFYIALFSALESRLTALACESA